MNINSIVIGYHGCTNLTAEKIFKGKSHHLNKSNNDDDWLGDGIYFWENDYQRAFDWAKITINRRKKKCIRLKKRVKHKLIKPAVIGAVIIPKYCLDLTTASDMRLLKSHYKVYEEALLAAKIPKEAFPKNKKAYEGDVDILHRKLDCAVIHFLHKSRKKANKIEFDSIRATFYEGKPIYEGSGFREKSHIQWAIRNPEKCILGYFRPFKNLA